MKHQKETGKNQVNVRFEEEYIPFAAPEQEKKAVWKYGVTSYWTPQIAFIASAYCNQSFFRGEERLDPGPTVKVEPSRARLLPEDGVLDTRQQIYLVRYLPGGPETNTRTGEEQYTIDYAWPVEILRGFNRGQCISVEVGPNGATVRMAAGQRPARDEENLEKIPYEHLLQGQAVQGNEYGVIQFHHPKAQCGYINSYHIDRDRFPDFKWKARSVLFVSNQVTFLPKGTVLDTRTKIYLVNFSVKGHQMNPKTGEFFPAVDPDVPVTVVWTIPAKECALLCPQKDSVLFALKENERPAVAFSVCVKALQRIIRERLSQSDYVLTSAFPQIARQAGVADFRLYADTVEEFVGRYLTDFKVLKNIVLNEIHLPGVIVPRKFSVPGGPPEPEEPEKISRVTDFTELDALFEAGDNEGFLSSPLFKETAFRDLPGEYQQKALTCAARILHQDPGREIVLEPFELALFQAEKGEDFIRKWKTKDSFDPEIFASYIRSSWIPYNLPKDSGRAFRELNDIGRIRTVNDNYTGLTDRFAQCGDRLTPYLYLLRILASPTPKTLRDSLGKYCQVVRVLRSKLNLFQVDESKNLFCMEELVQAVRRLMPNIEFPGNLITNLTSIFVDCGCIDRAAGMLSAVDPHHTAAEWELMDLYQNAPVWTEERLRALLRQGSVNRQLFQKTVSLIWERYTGQIDLPESFLRLLAWICVWDDAFSMDEILRYHFKPGFVKHHKMRQLCQAHGRICRWAAGLELPMYTLACYTANGATGDLDEGKLSPEMVQSVQSMDAVRQQVCAAVLQNEGWISKEHAPGYETLFRIFRFDFSVLEKLQRDYADWYLQKPMEDCSPQELEAHLKHLIQNGAHEAYTRVYALYAERCPAGHILPQTVETYIMALIQMHRFSEAMQYLRTGTSLAAETREILQIRVLSENFRLNALGDRAFQILEAISWEEAHTLLMAHLRDLIATAIQTVNSLMALYCRRGQYGRVAYLYKIYQPKAENGYTRLYSDIRKHVPQVSSRTFKNHYDVITWMFSVLDVEELVAFFQWAREVPIPAFRELNLAHGFSFFYENLLANPLEPRNWESFLSHLNKRMSLNLWQIVVCEIVLEKQSAAFSPTNSGLALSHILDNREPAELPYNLLPYALAYLMKTSDRSMELCEKLTKALSDPDVVQHLVQDNPWYPTYLKTMERFQSYVMQYTKETGSTFYFKLLDALPLALDPKDLLVMSLHGNNIQRAFVQLCQNYLDGGKQVESRKFLTNVPTKNLLPRERSMLELLTMLYDEDEHLLLRYPLLFRDENEVIRFKQDCASILADYPGKTGLKQFERNGLDLAHKMTVYAFVFKVLYDEDLYHAPEYGLESVDLAEERTRYAYLLFRQNCYLAQLDFNVAYVFFYKKWRYLKMLLAAVLLHWNEDCDDSFILTTMRQYDHYDSIYHNDYEPFRSDVFRFARAAAVPLGEQTKQAFLLALMDGRISWFLQAHAAELPGLSDEGKDLTARIIAKLDYREVAGSFFKQYGQELAGGAAGPATQIARVLSPRLVDVLEALQRAMADGKDCGEILRLAQDDHPTACANEIFKLETETFTRLADVIVPVVFSRQFPFQLYRSIREKLIVNRRNEGYLGRILEKFSLCCRYAARNERNIGEIYVYLNGLRWCLLDRRDQAKEALSGQEVWVGIPQSWQDEAQRMMDYAEGRQESFQPDALSMDSSLESDRPRVHFTFVTELQKCLNIDPKPRGKSELEELRARYDSGTLTPDEMLKVGVALLASTPQNEEQDRGKVSPWEELLLEVGLEAIRPESGISADVQLTIASELLEATAGRGKVVAAKFEQLLENFRQIPSRGVSLAGWVEHADSIQKYLGFVGMSGVETFAQLNENIIQPCGRLLGPDHDDQERLAGFRQLSGKIRGADTVYAANVNEAVQNEIQRIESGVQLSICCNEQEAVTDGYVYYQLCNTGKKTAQLDTKVLRVWFRQDDYLPRELEFSGLNELQSGFVTGGRARLYLEEKPQQVSVEFWVTQAENETILCRIRHELPVRAGGQEFTVREDEHVYDVRRAVDNGEMLFGRKDLKDRLRLQLTHGKNRAGSLAVIYGPSRIGKTSLLNWVANDYAREKGNVIRVRFGGEGGLGADTDYRNSFVPQEYPEIPYTDNQAMSEYLLSCTIRRGLNMVMRRRWPESKPLLPKLISSIESFLSDRKLSLMERYHNVNELLREAGLELWLLLDEFQKVVEQWKTITRDCAFVQLCLALNYPGTSLTQIKLVVCGSDDLLKHMVLEDNSVWWYAFKRAGIAVDALLKEPFCQMIQEERGIAGANVRYSKAALNALFSYTGGVALYGKEICNVILKDIASRPEEYRGRNEIYVRDVAWATQTLLNMQDEELRTGTREGIREIYQAVTHTLDPDTDMQYLWYIAFWLHNNPDRDSFPESEFTQHELVNGEAALKNALTIAVERKILRRAENQDALAPRCYTFGTIFYYCAFLGGVNLGKLERDKIFLQDPASPSNEVPTENPSKIDRFRDLFSSMDEGEQMFAVGGILMSSESKQMMRRLREMAGTNIQYEFQGDVMVNVAVQYIGNTIRNIMTADNPRQIRENLIKLPRLDNYFQPGALAELTEKLDSSDPEQASAAEAAIGEKMDQMSSGYRMVLAMQEEPAGEKPIWEKLGIDRGGYEELQKALDPSLMVDLYFAARLEKIFCRGMEGEDDQQSQIDYSPVTIMYCKTLEKALKLYHTDIYIQRLPGADTQVKHRGNRVKFGALRDQKLRRDVQNKIMIGAFLSPIDPYRNSPKNPPQYEAVAGNVFQVGAWQIHSKMLYDAKKIRNDSAHGAKGVIVTAEDLRRLKELLLVDKGLVHIVELTH